MSSAIVGSSTTGVRRSRWKNTTRGSFVSMCRTAVATSYVGSLATTVRAPVVTSNQTSWAAFARSEVMHSSREPSGLNASGLVHSASWWSSRSIGRHGDASSSRTRIAVPPSGDGASAARMRKSSSATNPMKPGFWHILSSSPLARSRR